MTKTLRQRYILFEIVTTNNAEIHEREIISAIWKQLGLLFGVQTSFMAGLWMVRWNSVQRMGILRCDNVAKQAVIASMAMITSIRGKNVIMHTRKTSGTIKKTIKLWKKYFNCSPPAKS